MVLKKVITHITYYTCAEDITDKIHNLFLCLCILSVGLFIRVRIRAGFEESQAGD